MALIKCKECGKEISSSSSVCPNCGIELKSFNKSKVIGISFVIPSFFLIFTNVREKINPNTNEANSEKIIAHKSCSTLNSELSILFLLLFVYIIHLIFSSVFGK